MATPTPPAKVPTYAEIISAHRKATDLGTVNIWAGDHIDALIAYIVQQKIIEDRRENPKVLGIGSAIVGKRDKLLDFEVEQDAPTAFVAVEGGNRQLERTRVAERLGIRYVVAQVIAVKEQIQ